VKKNVSKPAEKNRPKTAKPLWPELVENALASGWCLDVGMSGVALKHAAQRLPTGGGAYVAGLYRYQGSRGRYARGTTLQEAIEGALDNVLAGTVSPVKVGKS